MYKLSTTVKVLKLHSSSTVLTRSLSSSISKNFLLARPFQNEIQETDFRMVEEELPGLQPGEFRTKGLFWSVDPYMRAYVTLYKVPVETVMFGGQVAKVVESKSDRYKVGDYVYGHFGWRTLTNVNLATTKEQIYKLPDLHGLPLSVGLGVVGMTGVTAYYGLLDICRPRPGETVAITGAAGAVGSTVGQIAKIAGCKVVGFAGSDDKVEWLKRDLKFDVAINYKSDDIRKSLKENVKNGIDCYFDNVGGELSTIIMNRMNPRGRIAICGSVSSYNHNQNIPQAQIVQPVMVTKELKMEGFLVNRWGNIEWQRALVQLARWVKEGKIEIRETVTEGFENLPKALIGLLRGYNTGKAVVKGLD